MQTPVALLGLPSVQDVIEKIASKFWGAFADALIPDEFKSATGKFFSWLVAIPNPARAASMPNIDQLHQNVMALAVAIFALVVVTASVRYFFAGVAGRANPVEALGRALGGGFGLLIYTWAFGNAIAIVNVLTKQFFAWPIVADGMGALAGAVFGGTVLTGGGPIAAIFSILAFILIIALIAMKIALLIILTMLYIGGPLAIAVWPLPELSGFTRSWLEVLKNVISVPLMWTLVFATAGVLAKDIPTLLGLGSSGIARTAITVLVGPIVAIIVFYIAFRIAAGSIASIRSAGSQMVPQGGQGTRLGPIATTMALGEGRGAVLRAVRGGTGGAAAAVAAPAATNGRSKLAVTGASNTTSLNSQAQRTATSSDQAASRGRSNQSQQSLDGASPAARSGAERPSPSGATRRAHDAPNPVKNGAQRLDSATPRANQPKKGETAPSVRRKASAPPPTAPAAGPAKAASAARPASAPNRTGQPSTPPPSKPAATPQSQRSKVERAGGSSPAQPNVAKSRAANRGPRLRRPKPGGAS